MVNSNNRRRWLGRIAAACMVGTIGTVSVAQTVTQNYWGPYILPQADITASGANSAWGRDTFYATNGVQALARLDSSQTYRNRYSLKNWVVERLKATGINPQFVAHRGWVEPNVGLAENTLDSVVQALSQGSNIVEIDIRLSKDNVLMALHDANLHRPLNDNRLISNVNSTEMAGKVSKIKTPGPQGYTWVNARDLWCVGGSKITTLASLMSNVGRGTTPTDPNNNRCNGYSQVTYVLDSKGPKETIAALKEHSGRSNVILKVYPKYYTNAQGWNCGTDQTKVAKCIFDAAGLSTSQSYAIKVMPVLDDVPSMIDKGQTDAAVAYGNATTKDWLPYFDVQSVEVPGAWSGAWIDVAGQMLRDMRNFARPHNEVWPVVSVGYRFSDFSVGGTYPLFRDAKQYNWDNLGAPVEDTKPKQRRMVTGQMPYYSSKNAYTPETTDVICGPHCMITTDAPFHEAYYYHYKIRTGEQVVNMPALNPKKP